MLRPVEVENLARRTVETILKGAKAEDSIIELKLTLPLDHRSAARQIAALCNATPESDAVWVVGVDETGNFSPPTEEFAMWAPAVNKFFDEVFPVSRAYNISMDGHPLTLIHFTVVASD